MASIHKDPRGKSPFFYCAFYLPNGKRAFRSTKSTDRNAALAFCIAMENAELANADVPADVRRQISGHSDEKIHERYTHLDLDSKRRALAKLRPLAA